MNWAAYILFMLALATGVWVAEVSRAIRHQSEIRPSVVLERIALLWAGAIGAGLALAI